MQNYALTIDKFLDHAAKWFGEQGVTTANSGTVIGRQGYAGLRERSNRLSGALLSFGMQPGDRIGTLAWNTQSHFEIYYAVMGCGLICHTLNPRFTAAHLAAIINEAQDRILAVASDLTPLLNELLPLCPTLEHIILLDGQDWPLPEFNNHTAKIWPYETLLKSHGLACEWGQFNEETPAGLCYTSGTTGKPKGVLYTHRSNYIHTLRALQADAVALRADDTVLAAVPMFHANAWGLPFAAPAVGAKLVLPGRQTDGESLAKLMRDEKVTIAVGVQTVWLGVIEHLDKTGEDLPDLKRVLIGGSKCPETLLRRLEERLGAQIQTSWGMTELSPLGTIAPPANIHSDKMEEQASGRPLMGLDLKLTDANGETLPEQRGVMGYLKVKGASVVDQYYKAHTMAVDSEGYFDTGDLASIDENGCLTICGRSKDLIKSGGEWINPAEIENIVGAHPAVALVAVIGCPDTKWGERPVLIVELSPNNNVDGSTVEPADLLKPLKGKIANWWMPTQVVIVPSMPLAPTGKIDKVRLRADFNSGKYAAA